MRPAGAADFVGGFTMGEDPSVANAVGEVAASSGAFVAFGSQAGDLLRGPEDHELWRLDAIVAERGSQLVEGRMHRRSLGDGMAAPARGQTASPLRAAGVGADRPHGLKSFFGGVLGYAWRISNIAPQRRTAPRVPVALDVTLSRGHGSAVPGRTQDLGPTGMRVASRRPLKVDEHLEFDIDLGDGGHVAGRAHVVREHGYGVYALRFDALADVARVRLSGLAARGRAEHPT